ncbi:MAG: hypothetical protein HYT62_00680 [Candidatus Yanofskybacteria bacterium]|nr:hypothetical protein [Candidatus Yanofskybacteria bacterium]
MELRGSRSWFWFSVFIVLVLLQVGDASLTYILATKTPPGIDMEANPLARYIFETFGLLCGMIVGKSIAIAAGFFIYTRTADKIRVVRLVAKSGLVFLVLVYIHVSSHNWNQIFILRHLGLI